MFQLPLHNSTKKIELFVQSNGIGDIIHKKEYVLESLICNSYVHMNRLPVTAIPH